MNPPVGSTHKVTNKTQEKIQPNSHAPITPNFPSGPSREIVGDYVEK